MQSPFVRWLLDLDVIPAEAEGVRLVWEHPWPAWVWFLLLLVTGFLATYQACTQGECVPSPKRMEIELISAG